MSDELQVGIVKIVSERMSEMCVAESGISLHQRYTGILTKDSAQRAPCLSKHRRYSG